MGKEQKTAAVVGVLVLAAAALAALLLKPSVDAWDKAQQLRQIFGLGVAGLALAWAMASVDRPQRRAPADQPTLTDEVRVEEPLEPPR
jgi:hypothetical protein